MINKRSETNMSLIGYTFIYSGNTALAMFPLSEPSNNTVDAYEAVPMLAMVQLQHHLGEQCAAEASVNYVTSKVIALSLCIMYTRKLCHNK